MHTRLTTGAHSGISAARNTAGHWAWVGEVTHPAGETPGELEQRWDAFTRLMFAYGVEPAQDAPDHSMLVDGVVTDRYRLQEIVEDGL